MAHNLNDRDLDEREEGRVAERSQTIAAALIGAVAGALAGYVLFTEQGRRWRRQLEPSLDEAARELSHLRGTLNRAVGVAVEGLNLLDEAVGGADSIRGRQPAPRQSAPF